MNPIKKKFAMTTDQGEDKKSVLFLALTGVLAIPDGHAKNILLGLWMISMSAISYFTVGHKADPEILDMKDNINDILSEGRK